MFDFFHQENLICLLGLEETLLILLKRVTLLALMLVANLPVLLTSVCLDLWLRLRDLVIFHLKPITFEVYI